jgi:DNA-binding beta-propeller fold protein YncE
MATSVTTVGVLNLLVKTFDASNFAGNNPAFTGMAIFAGSIVVGTNSNALFSFVEQLLGNAPFSPIFPLPTTLAETCFSAAFDSVGNLYCANLDKSLTFYPMGNYFLGGKTLIANMGFVATGLAVDKTLSFIYVANGIGSSIAVYNTNGTPLTTIKN